MSNLHNFMKIGRVCLINFGDDEGKLCTVVDIIDQNRALVDGPANLTGVHRQQMPLKRLSITPLCVKIGRGARNKSLNKAWTNAKVQEKWENSSWARRIAQRKTRASLNDFQRFQVMILRKQKSKVLKRELGKVRKAAAKARKASKA